MQSKHAFIGGLLAAAFIAAACGSTGAGGTGRYGGTPSATPSAAPVVAPTPSPTPAATGTSIAVASSKLGAILVDASGRTLYLFLADSATSSACNSAACVQYWPPLLTTGTPQAGTGVTASLLGTIKRQDSTSQVTYAGHPLYYFLTDKKAGDVTGQGVNGFGAPWYVVAPSGMQIS